jgi:hypothetical protein
MCRGQGSILHARINATGEEIFICDACDSVWLSTDELESPAQHNFSDYAATRGLKGIWPEITILNS